MTLKYILKAAVSSMIRGHHTPHCYRAHTIGRGYVNDGSAGHDRVEYLRQLERDAQSEIDNMTYALGYAEPGYTDPAKGIVLANWNQLASNLDSILERAGYDVQWSDEWSECGDCGKLVRTSADSYGWRASFVLYNDCELCCHNCIREDLDEYEEHLLNRSDIADTLDVDWSERGFTRMNVDHYENGFHPGQNEPPKDITKHIPSDHDYLFSIARVQQFDIAFDVWIRPQEREED